MTFRARPHGLDVLVRTVRFFYLLWGGMLLGSLALSNRVRPPEWLWNWPRAAHFLTTPTGRGMLLGAAVVLALAALFEAWELVDRVLGRFLHDHEHSKRK